EEREYDAAERAYGQALALDPNLESAAIGQALSLSALGRPADAARILDKAYASGRRSLNLLHVMTTLPAGLSQVDVLRALDELSGRMTAADARSRNTLLFARAAALDQAGRHAEAWQVLVEANRPLAAEYKSDLAANVARRERALARLRSTPVAASRAGGS